MKKRIDTSNPEQTAIAKLIYMLEKLQKEKINVSEIPKSKKVKGKQISTILKEVVSPEIIEKYGWNGEDKIGQRIAIAIQAYRGRVTVQITEEEKHKLEELGIIKEKQTAMAELIDILEKLQLENIDVSKIRKIKTETGTPLETIVSPEIIEKYGWDGEYRIGQQISAARKAYNGNGEHTITEEEKKKLKKFGITDKKQTAMEELIDVLEKLKQEEIDVSKIKQKKTLPNGKISYTRLVDIITSDILEKYSLNEEYEIGRHIHDAKQAYKGKLYPVMKEGEKKKLEQLGIVGKLSKKEAQQQQLQAKRDFAKQLYESAKTILGKEK